LKILAKSHNNAGLMYAAKGSTGEAEAVYKKAVDVYQQLIQQDPEEISFQLFLARTHNNLGLLYSRIKKDDLAESEYRLSFELLKAIHDDHPQVVEYQLSLAGAYANMATHIRRTRSADESLEWLAPAIVMDEKMLEDDPRFLPARMGLFDSLMGRAYALVELQRPEEAANDWRRVIEISEGQDHISMRLYRPFAHVFLGDHATAAAEIESLVTEGHTQGRNRLLFAKVLSRCSAAVAQDARLSPAEQEQLAERYGARAVALLRQAQADGLFQDPGQVAQLRDSSDLDSLRTRPDFTSLLAELDAHGNPKP
jgi:tetratricopeptide (TPR) repeat protein